MSTKDFQVRHGLVVNNNVLVANVITNRVGVGTSDPQHLLDVAGTVNVQTIFINGSNIVSDIISANSHSGNMANAANAYAGSMSNSSNNFAGSMANAANLYTNSVGSSANAASKNYTNVSTDSANSYGGIMANAANAYAGAMANSSNAYAVSVGDSVNTYSMMFSNTTANSANLYTNTVGVAANSYSGYMANSANVFTSTVFTVSNAAFLAANSAYNKVNTAATITTGNTAPVNPHEGDLWWNSDAGTLLIWFTDADSSQWIEAYAGSEVLISDIVYRAYDQSNVAYNQSNTAFDQSNTAVLSVGAAYDKANAANVLAYNTGIGANSYAGSMANSSNNFAGTLANSSNAYAGTLSNNSNSFTSTVFGVTNSSFSVANAAFGKANTALQNTTGTFAGTLTFTGGVTLSNTNLANIKNAYFNAQGTISTTSGSITVDWTAAQNWKQTEPTGTITYTFTAPPGPCHLQLLIDSDGSSTAQSFSWPGTVVWMGQTWVALANKKAVINFWYDGSTYYGVGTNQA